MPIPVILENSIYTASPAGKERVKNPNIIGIIQSIILLVCCCLASPVLKVVIFCCNQVVAPTNRGNMIMKILGVLCTGSTKFIVRNSLLIGN